MVIAVQVPKRIYATSVTENVAFGNSLPIHAESAYRRRTGISDANMRSASFAKEIGRSARACSHKRAEGRDSRLFEIGSNAD